MRILTMVGAIGLANKRMQSDLRKRALPACSASDAAR